MCAVFVEQTEFNFMPTTSEFYTLQGAVASSQKLLLIEFYWDTHQITWVKKQAVVVCLPLYAACYSLNAAKQLSDLPIWAIQVKAIKSFNAHILRT